MGWLGTPRSCLGVGEERLEGGEDVAAIDVLEGRAADGLFAPLDDRRVVLSAENDLDDGDVIAVDFAFVAECSPTKARVTLLQKIEQLLGLHFKYDRLRRLVRVDVDGDGVALSVGRRELFPSA